ncbi:serine/threonine-protein kinase 32B-like [Ptychodera flava]|uniref:serine/threonine-protein kinase 32B-like n=1 Tax=Ptychodera flava TaxID=63121 RepID=UPI00396A673A
MGGNHSARKHSFDANGEVNFDHFQILRAIGKGSFGKVCIVQKKDTKKMFAMKYMNKAACIKKDAVKNVLREQEILQHLEHPFLVNLWFTFQDEEDMFMVVDLLLGGDLRYHIQQDVKFDSTRVRLYICEIALALEYLRSHFIIHRDIKPDNILLDEEGHVHITDFNIAAICKDGSLPNSMSGTKPYMAPEVFACAIEENSGYSFPVDWWSTGVCAYEMIRGKRPYDIHSNTSISDVQHLFAVTNVYYPSSWDNGLVSLLRRLLTIHPDERISTLEELKIHPFVSSLDFNAILGMQIKPTFVPAKDHLNCDPTFELEEMIIEAKPLHKKKKRLAKQGSKNSKDNKIVDANDPMQVCLENINADFKVYNRERIKHEKEKSDKESTEKEEKKSKANRTRK